MKDRTQLLFCSAFQTSWPLLPTTSQTGLLRISASHPLTQIQLLLGSLGINCFSSGKCLCDFTPSASFSSIRPFNISLSSTWVPVVEDMVLKETAGMQPPVKKWRFQRGQMGCMEKALTQRENAQSLVGESCPNGQQFSPVKGQANKAKQSS